MKRWLKHEIERVEDYGGQLLDILGKKYETILSILIEWIALSGDPEDVIRAFPNLKGEEKKMKKDSAGTVVN